MEKLSINGQGTQKPLTLELSAKDRKAFSLLEVCKKVADPTSTTFGRPDPAGHSLDILASAAMISQPRNGHYVLPADLTGIGTGAYIAGSAAGAVTDGPAGGFLVDENAAGRHVDALRPFSKVWTLADRIDGAPPGELRVSRTVDQSAASWLDEDGAAPDQAPSVGLLTASAKTAAASIYLTRSFLKHAAPGAEQRLQRDLMQALAQKAEEGFLSGIGARIEPLGLLNWDGTGSVVGGTDGAIPNYDHMVKLEAALRNANVDSSRLAYLMPAAAQATLKRTPEHATAAVGGWIWQPYPGIADPTVGRVNGYPAHVSNLVPSDLVKGGSGAVCSAILFGDFSKVLVVSWGGIELIINKYTDSKKGGVTITAFLDVDLLLLKAEALAIMRDALPMA